MAEQDNTQVPTFDIEGSYKLDISGNEAAKIFPQSYEDAFNVSKEEKKNLWESIKDDYKDDGIFDKYFNLLKPLERGERYQEELVGLEQEALDNKTNHISNVVGAPVENVGMTNLKDMSLVFDISRSKLLKNRKNKFLKTFPEGEYYSVPINVGDGKTETYELFKYNKSDKKYKILNPDGRNMTEMAAIAGMFLDEQLTGDILMLAGPKIMQRIGAAPNPIAKVVGAAGVVLDKIPPTTRVMMGNWLGLKGKKLNEWLRGHGEEEFEMAETLGEVNPNKFLFDLSDWGNAALSGAMYKGVTETTNWLLKGKTPGMVELTEDIVRAAKKLDLDPLIFAQLSTNPIVRRMFTQAGLFTDRPNKLKLDQINKLKSSLENYGIGKGTGQLDMGQVNKLYDELSLLVGDKIKMFNKNFPDQKSQSKALDEAINTWNKTNTKIQSTKTQSIFANAEHLDNASINIDSFARLFKKRYRSFVTETEKKSLVNVLDDSGLPLKKHATDATGKLLYKLDKLTGKALLKDGEKVPLMENVTTIKSIKGKYGDADKILSGIGQAIKQMVTPKNASKSNLPMNTLSQLNDPKFKNLETLFNMRDELFKLTTNSDPKISGAAVDLHNQLKLILDPSNGYIKGSSELISKVNILNKHMDGADNVRMLGFVKDAMGKAKDPDAFVKQFLVPGSSLKVQQLKNILLDGAGDKVEREGAAAAFNIIRKAWFNNMLQTDDGIKQLNKWVTRDLDGVKLFLGDGWQGKVAEMKNIIGLQNKLSDGILAQSLKGTEREIADKIMTKAAEKGVIGHGKYFDDIIKDYGGFDSNGVEMIRFHLIKDMLDKASTIVETGQKMLSDTIDPRILRQEIRKLQKNSYLMKFFDDGVERLSIANTDKLAKQYGVKVGDQIKLHPPMIEALQNYNLYTTALAGQSDVGGMIAAGALANKTSEGIFKPSVILETGLSILKHDIVSRLLSKKISASYLSKLDAENVLSKANLQLINGSISEVAKELIGTSQGYNKMEDNGIIHSFTKDDIDTSLRGQGTGSGSMMLPNDKNLILSDKTSFNTNRPINQSRSGSPNLGFRPVGAGSADPNTYAKGQQLFGNNPREITFAAQGGIMNTRTAFQRVA